MGKTIAWVRLSLYSGSSLLLLSEGYRLLLIYLPLVISSPALLSIAQFFVQWGLLLGFVLLNLGFMSLLAVDPPLLDSNTYSFIILKRKNYFGCGIIIILFILILLPPTISVTQEVGILFTSLVSLLWTLYYGVQCIWIVHHWFFVKKIINFHDFLKKYRLSIHIALGGTLTFQWFLVFISLIIFNINLFDVDLFNLFYISILAFFLIFQIIFFYEITRFSFKIYG